MKDAGNSRRLDASLSRRSFLAGGAAALAAGAACATGASKAYAADEAAKKLSERAIDANDHTYRNDRLINMENVLPIDPVAEPAAYDYETDVLLVGFGVGGTSAALSCANAGVNVIAMETSTEDTWYEHGGVHVIAEYGEPSWLERAGINAITSQMTPNGEPLPWDDMLIDTFIDLILDKRSDMSMEFDAGFGQKMDFSLDDREAFHVYMKAGHEAMNQIRELGSGAQFDYVEIFPAWKILPAQVPTNDNIEGGSVYHPWVNKYHAVENVIRDHCLQNGLEVLWGTRAVALIQNAEGRVVGAKGVTRDGKEVFVKAACTIDCIGGIGANYDMCKYYGQIDQMVGCHVGPITNDGMGVRMCHGVGAGDRGTPRWPAVLSESGIDTVSLGLPWTFPHEAPGFEDRQLSAYTYAGINLARQANLKVNKYGKRFMKEDLDWQPRLWTEFQQPGHRFYSIFDGDIEANIAETNQRYGMCEYLITPDRHVYFNNDDIRPMWNWQDELEDAVERGFIVKADTLEELAEKLDINAENFVETVNHYNEVVASGVDTDYGKTECLFPVAKPPYYGIERCTGFAWQVQGSIAMDAATGRVLDTKGAVIPGLYCGSNDGAAADVDTEVNVMTPTGGGAAGAITAGYLAGKAAAEEAKALR